MQKQITELIDFGGAGLLNTVKMIEGGTNWIIGSVLLNSGKQTDFYLHYLKQDEENKKKQALLFGMN
jgi:hypothetical protein